MTNEKIQQAADIYFRFKECQLMHPKSTFIMGAEWYRDKILNLNDEEIKKLALEKYPPKLNLYGVGARDGFIAGIKYILNKIN